MLNQLLQIHKKTVLIGGNGFAVDCVLKQNASVEGFEIKAFSTFVGLTFNESGTGFFGDSFELTVDADDVRAKTNLTPTHGWFVDVTFPQMNNQTVTFAVENVAIDRTIGVYLLKCTATTGAGKGKRVNRNAAGGI